MTFIVPHIFLNIGISSRKFVWGLYWQCASFLSFLCTNNDCFTWITPPFSLKSFKCYFRSSILILINTVLKLWNKQRFCSFVYGYYTYIYYVYIMYLPFQEAKSGRSLLTNWDLKMHTFVVLTIVLQTLLNLF